MSIKGKNKILKSIKWVVIFVFIFFLLILCYVVFSSANEIDDINKDLNSLSDSSKSPEDIVKDLENNPAEYSLKEIADFYQKEEIANYQDRIFNLFCKKLSLYSVDELLQQIKGIKTDALYYVVLDSLESKAFHEGPLEISKVYKANLDEDWECLIEPFVIESLDGITLVEHKELLPYYIDTPYQIEIEEIFSQRTRDSLLTLKDNYINYIVCAIDSVIIPMIDKDVTMVYEEFFGGLLGWNNFKNNVFKTKEATNSEFDKVWKKHIEAETYNNIYQIMIQDSLNYYLDSRKCLANDLGVSSTISLRPSKIPLTYDKDIMRHAVENNKWIAYKDVADVGIGIFTLPIGGAAGWLIFAASFGVDFGIDNIPIFKDPEDYFKFKESMNVYKQFLSDVERQSQEMQLNDQQLIEDIIATTKDNYE